MAAIAAAAAKEIYRIARAAPTDDIDAWFGRVVAQVMELLAAFFETLRRLTAAFLEEHASLSGLVVEPAVPDWLARPAQESMRITGPVAFKQNMSISGDAVVAREVMAKRMAGAAQRVVLDGERRTVKDTIDSNAVIVGWRRVTDGDPCAWCAMLASRGAVYKTRGSATSVTVRKGKGRRGWGQSYHDYDGCTAVPLYEGEEEPPEVQDLQDQWDRVTAGKSGSDAVRTWRQYWDGREG